MDKVSFRPEEAHDAPAIRQLLLQAFPTSAEADLVEALRANKSVWDPGVSYLAVTDEGQVIGQALLTRCWIDSAPALALAPCAVAPEFQGQGVGTAAIEAALNHARQEARTANYPQAVIVLGHADYYPRFGFEKARNWGIRAPFDVPTEAFMVLNLNSEFDLPAGVVRYPSEFGIDSEDDDL